LRSVGRGSPADVSKLVEQRGMPRQEDATRSDRTRRSNLLTIGHCMLWRSAVLRRHIVSTAELSIMGNESSIASAQMSRRESLSQVARARKLLPVEEDLSSNDSASLLERCVRTVRGANLAVQYVRKCPMACLSKAAQLRRLHTGLRPSSTANEQGS
jgi:hypothetical protein